MRRTRSRILSVTGMTLQLTRRVGDKQTRVAVRVDHPSWDRSPTSYAVEPVSIRRRFAEIVDGIHEDAIARRGTDFVSSRSGLTGMIVRKRYLPSAQIKRVDARRRPHTNRRLPQTSSISPVSQRLSDRHPSAENRFAIRGHCQQLAESIRQDAKQGAFPVRSCAARPFIAWPSWMLPFACT